MPFKRKRSYGRRRFVVGRRRTSFKRGFRRTRRTYRRGARYSSQKIRGVNYFKDQTVLKLKSTIVWIPTTSTTSGGAVFACVANSIADPMGTGSAIVQPTGLDQMAAYYTRYYVSGAALKLTAYALDDDVSLTMWPTYVETITDASYTPAGLINPLTIPYSKTRTVMSTQEKPMRMKSYMSTWKISAGTLTKNNNISLGTLATTTSTDPTSTWLWQIRAWNMFDNTAAVTVRVLIELTQYVTCFRARTLPISAQ